MFIDNNLRVDFNIEMKFMMEKMKQNNLMLVLITLGLIVFPIFCKLMITGVLGPNFSFYFFICWIPVVSMGIATLRGWQESALTGILIVSALLFSVVSYPQNASMDFHRQIVHQSNIAIIMAALISLALQVHLKHRKNGHAPGLVEI